MKNIILMFFCFLYFIGYSQVRTIYYKFKQPVDKSQSEKNLIKNALGIAKDIKLIELIDLRLKDKYGYHHKTYIQFFNGIKVEFSNLKVHFKEEELISVNGDYITNISPIKATISKNEAQLQAIKVFKDKNYLHSKKGSESLFNYRIKSNDLVYLFNPNKKDNIKAELCYKFDILSDSQLKHEWIYISAKSALLTFKLNKTCATNGIAETRYSGTRVISTENTDSGYRLVEEGTERCEIETTINNGFIVDDNNEWEEAEYNNSTLHQVALDIHWGAEMFFDYFNEQFDRNSIDDNGFKLKSNYDTTPLDNAFWYNNQIHIFRGNNIFETTASLDIVAHEFGHGLCEKTCDLIYMNESGAINEGLSDIWGACVEFFSAPEKNHWLLGEDVILTGSSLRSMKNPNIKEDPDTYKGNFWIFDEEVDNGGVHTNSGVLNYWFYILTEGESNTNDNGDNYHVEGIGIQNSASIIYRAETVYFTNTTDYHDARNLTIQSAKDIFGVCSDEVKSVINSWHAVGVGGSVDEENSIFLFDNVASFSSDYNYSFTLLEAFNIIEKNAFAIYESSNQINLKNGFHAKPKSNFKASIVECQEINGYEDDNPTEFSTQYKIENNIILDFNCYPNPVRSVLYINFETNFNNNGIYNCLINMEVLLRNLELETTHFQ